MSSAPQHHQQPPRTLPKLIRLSQLRAIGEGFFREQGLHQPPQRLYHAAAQVHCMHLLRSHSRENQRCGNINKKMQQKRCSNKRRCSKQNADILAQSGAESAQSGAESDVNLKVPVCVCVCLCLCLCLRMCLCRCLCGCWLFLMLT